MRAGWETLVYHSGTASLVESIKGRIITNSELSCSTPTTIRPQDVDPAKYGQHASFVEDGMRHWIFDSVEMLNKFRKDHL